MHWIYPNSSAIEAIGYDGATLAVIFHKSGRYDHCGVPESVYRAFVMAPSVGAYYSYYIRGRY